MLLLRHRARVKGIRSLSPTANSEISTATSAGKGELQIAQNLRIDLPAGHGAKTVRSLLHGPLTLTQNSVMLPKLAEIDLLILE